MAAQMRRSGPPAAIAAAERYSTSGSTGYGFPESSVGLWVAAALFGGSAWIALAVGGAQAGRRERAILAAAAVVSAHMAFVLLRNAMVFIAFFGGQIALLALGGGLVAISMLTAAAIWPLAWAWRVRPAATLLAAVGAAAGVLVGVAVDHSVYWYEWRNEAGEFMRGLSLLEAAVATAITVAATFLPALDKR